jgi:hypothetical protein
MRSKFAESGKFAWMDSLPPKIKKKLDELSKELTETHTSEQRRAAIVIEIEQLLAPYRK